MHIVLTASSQTTISTWYELLYGNKWLLLLLLLPHVLRSKTEDPTYVKQFPIPAAHLTFFYQQVDKLLRLGAIREDYSTPHNSPVFAMIKPHSNKLRFVLDLRKVNECMYDDNHSFMDVHQYLHRLGGLGANFMSALDLNYGSWQLALHDSSQEYTAFTVPGRGKFVWTVTPMGLKASPSAFSRPMEFVFCGFKNSVIYLDDVLVGSKTLEEHIHHLEDSFRRLQRYNLKQLETVHFCSTRDRISRIHHFCMRGV